MESKMEMGFRDKESITNYDLRITNLKSKLVPECLYQGIVNLKSQTFLLLAAYFLLLAVLPCCGRKDEEDSIRKTLPKEGEIASAFSLQLLSGKQFRLGDIKERPMVINFWASWCHPCRQEAPALQKVYALYKDKGVVFIGIAIQDTETKAKAYVKEFGITFPVGLDSTGAIAEAYKIYGIPKTFIIGKDGRLSYIHMGEITEDDLIKGIEKVVI